MYYGVDIKKVGSCLTSRISSYIFKYVNHGENLWLSEESEILSQIEDGVILQETGLKTSQYKTTDSINEIGYTL